MKSFRDNARACRVMLVLIAVLALSSLALSSDSRPKCTKCGMAIEGQYIEVDGRYYHPEHFLCAYCDRPIGEANFLEIDGLNYHKSCYDQHLAPRCAACDKIIEGQYYEMNGKLYHATCFTELIAPRCDVCGEPILDSMQTQDSLNYHYECYWDSVVGDCSYCGGKIRDEYVTDTWGNRYHGYHLDQAVACEYCGRLISERLTGGGTQYNDGRQVCNLCAGSSITDGAEALRLMDEVADSLAQDGIIVNTAGITINLLDRENLGEEVGGLSEMNFGFTRAEFRESGAERRLTGLNIDMLYGLPHTLAYATLAHELMHAHFAQSLHSPESDTLTEGSCHYAAYLALRRLESEDRDFYLDWIENDRSDVYGGGFRRVRELVERKGFDFWMDWIHANEQFPAGF